MLAVLFRQADTKMNIVIFGQFTEAARIGPRNRAGSFMRIGIDPSEQGGLGQTGDIGAAILGGANGAANPDKIASPVTVERDAEEEGA